MEERLISTKRKKSGSTWEASQKRSLEKFNKEAFAGHSDWRLPTRKELESLFTKKIKIFHGNIIGRKMSSISIPIFGYSQLLFLVQRTL